MAESLYCKDNKGNNNTYRERYQDIDWGTKCKDCAHSKMADKFFTDDKWFGKFIYLQNVLVCLTDLSTSRSLYLYVPKEFSKIVKPDQKGCGNFVYKKHKEHEEK